MKEIDVPGTGAIGGGEEDAGLAAGIDGNVGGKAGAAAGFLQDQGGACGVAELDPAEADAGGVSGVAEALDGFELAGLAVDG